jgi:beta-hydroxylase
MIKWIILAIFILSALYIQQRGKVRHSFYRHFSIFDHSTILAPINYLMYMFSKVGGVLKSMLTLNEAIIDVKEG